MIAGRAQMTSKWSQSPPVNGRNNPPMQAEWIPAPCGIYETSTSTNQGTNMTTEQTNKPKLTIGLSEKTVRRALPGVVFAP
jgi:hypothetical protein